MASEANGSGEPGMFTVTVATPVTTVPSGLVDIAVMAVMPFKWAVTIPVAGSTEATEGTLDFHVAAGISAPLTVAVWPVRFTVVLFVVVPMATSPAV